MPHSNDSAHALKTAQARIYDGRFEEALEALSGVGETAPDHAEALYMTAVCLRYLKRYDEAFSVLQRLMRAAPDFGRGWQERGHLYRALEKSERALPAFQAATAANPALEASWRGQAEILRMQGRTGEAAHALAQADRLVKLPRELAAVANLIHEGKLLKAENLCRLFLQQNPKHVEGMRLLADIGSRMGVLDDAEFLLESALAFEPENVQVRLDYIQLLRKRQRFQAALAQAKHLFDKDPENPIFQSHYAIESLQTGDFERALSLFESVLEKLPNDPATLTSRGHALKTYGGREEAIESYRKACRARPGHGDAWYGLANLKTYRFTDEELAAMREHAEREDIAYRDHFHICFALGKALEDRCEYEESFKYYKRGNDLKRARSGYDAETMTKELSAQAAYCTAELFEKHKGAGHPAPDPIFIVGLPRAGSTLLEQILASHSQVDGTLELPNILSLSRSLRGRRAVAGESAYPKILHDLPRQRFDQMGRAYIDDTRIHRMDAPFFTDKMPNNFRHIGLIHLILPNAKIIDARREAMACCFSGYKQLFAEGQEFTYGLYEIGRYYCDYVELMNHWDKMLPGKILRVQHEDVIADLEGQVRRMLDFCGLPFEESCLEFYKTKRSVRTASSEQVRRPIYDTGVEQWRNYETFLEPLKAALGSGPAQGVA